MTVTMDPRLIGLRLQAAQRASGGQIVPISGEAAFKCMFDELRFCVQRRVVSCALMFRGDSAMSLNAHWPGPDREMTFLFADGHIDMRPDEDSLLQWRCNDMRLEFKEIGAIIRFDEPGGDRVKVLRTGGNFFGGQVLRLRNVDGFMIGRCL